MKNIGRYEIVEELGRGAMGVVYKASDPTIGRQVAIKVLSLEPPKEAGVPGTRDIFIREARAAGRLSHPGIVTIHDASEDSETRSGYIVMEFIPGRTLDGILLSGPPASLEQALDITRQVAEALDYAHRHQVIHRDLKPANILLTEDGRAKITDFGIAKIVAREGALRTAAIMGTPSYMSPEQVTGGEVDARSDLFSLGIILYLLLTGQKPFPGDTAAVMFKIVYEDPVLPSTLNTRLSAGHDYLVLRCLAKDRNKRYASAREILDDLEDVQQGRTPRSQAQFPMSELRVGERTLIGPPWTAAPPAVPRATAQEKRKWGYAALAAGGFLLVALVSLGIWKYYPREAPPPPSRAVQNRPPVRAPADARPASAGEAKPAKAPHGVPKEAKPQIPRGKTVTPPATPTAAAPRVPPETKQPQPVASTETSPPAPTEPVSSKPLAAGKVVQLLCRHELREATLTVSSGARALLAANLKGKKKRGFLGIKGGYTGMLSRPVTVPAGARELTVHIVSPDGSVDLSKTISASPPAGPSPTLQIGVSRDRLVLNWGKGANPPDSP